MKYRHGVRGAIADAMEADERVMLLGVDIAKTGGPFAITRGLLEEFGPERVRDAPIAEMGLLGAAVGAALSGLRPVVELMYADFIGVCLDPLLNQAAKARLMSGGEARVPLVVRTQFGGGGRAGAQHSQSLEGLFAAIPGLKVVCPGSPADAYGLLRSAIDHDDPVVYIEHRGLYPWDDPGLESTEGVSVPLGAARRMRAGRDVTCVTYSRYARTCETVAERVSAEHGIEVDLIDLRSIHPLDWDTVLASVRHTSRVLVVHEAPTDFGVGAEVAAGIADRAFWHLDAPVKRIGARRLPLAFSPPLEDATLPAEADIEKGIIELCKI